MGSSIQVVVASLAMVALLIFMWLAVPTEQTLDLKFPNVRTTASVARMKHFQCTLLLFAISFIKAFACIKFRALLSPLGPFGALLGLLLAQALLRPGQSFSLMSGLAALIEQKLTGLHSYFGQANCFSAPGSPKHLSVSTAFGATVLAASSLETDSYEEELSTAVLKNDLTMPQVPKEDTSLRTDDATVMSSAPRSRLARSDTMEASLQSSQLPNLGKFEPLSTLKDEFKFNKSFGEKVDGLIEHETCSIEVSLDRLSSGIVCRLGIVLCDLLDLGIDAVMEGPAAAASSAAPAGDPVPILAEYEVVFTVPVWFSPEKGLKLQDLLPWFDIELGFEASEVIFAATLPYKSHHCPPLSELSSVWAPWDHPICEEQQIHFLLTDRSIWQQMRTIIGEQAIDLMDEVVLHDNRLQTHLHVHFVAGTSILYHVGMLYDRIKELHSNHEQRLRNLEAAHRVDHARLGVCAETIATQHPDLAGPLGLLLTADDVAGNTAPSGPRAPDTRSPSI
eukprot:s3328_g4.t1